MNLEVLEYNIALPEKIKFHWPGLYQLVIKRTLRKILKRRLDPIDVCIDFGCYQQYQSISWIPAKTHIFFPVDDYANLKADSRGADLVLSVSENICRKFEASGKVCHFINHGLNKEFEENAVRILRGEKFWKRREKIKIGYSGNLFISFLDIPVVRKIIQENPRIEFHFFGSTNYNKENKEHVAWNGFLKNTPNVVLHGFLHPRELVRSLNEMDGFLLCYKPDYKNYHAENSHKVFEYLSTGKVLITTYLSIYQDNHLMKMSGKDNNEALINIFTDTIKLLEIENSPEIQKDRIILALDNTYNRQIKRIGDIIENAG
ncbi:MAG: hypothetical protein H3C64_11015 [Candidatus Kuenenia stuttgartiensis]|nr:hypothetical protein [Candidatus Kuenenia stuttgartiensis]